MLKRRTRWTKPALVLLALLLALLVAPTTLAAPNAQGAVTFNLCATTGSVTMPDGAVIPIWGFSVDNGGGNCDPAQLPGPALDGITAGSTVTVNLTNQLPVATSILFPGQVGVVASGGAPGTLTAEAPPGGSVSYTFVADTPGTFMYESGSAPERQVAMGLYGALIVRPATPGRAYDDPASAYHTEALLVLSEIDPNLNADPLGFNPLDYHPTYWLINGKAYPDTLPIEVHAGHRLLLRYLNAGAVHHSMSLLGLHQRIIARDGFLLNLPFDAVAETIPSGQTTDAIVTVSADPDTRLPLYNRQLHVTNGELAAGEMMHTMGGMMTFVNVLAPNILNFNDFTIESYGGNQDVNATATVLDGGATLQIVGNGWKKIALPYNVVHSVNGSTVLEFDFMSTAQGEIHGIGFDTDDALSSDRTFKLYGTQGWGIPDFNNYAADAPNWKHYKIPVGLFYTGQMNYLIFANDHDAGSPPATSYFRNVEIYDETPPLLTITANGSAAGYLVESYGGGQDVQASVTLSNNGNTMQITGNGWKKVSLPYNVTPNTILEFDFESTAGGEIHGIGFDTDNNISSNYTFQLYGTQTWGLQDFHNYGGSGVTHYTIPVGQYYTGNMLYLTFTNDHDITNPNATSIFSNIVVREGP